MPSPVWSALNSKCDLGLPRPRWLEEAPKGVNTYIVAAFRVKICVEQLTMNSNKNTMNAEQNIPSIQFQADSEHSSILQTAITAGITDLVINPLNALSASIGRATGLSGLFDEPLVPVKSECINAVVDTPQRGRSLKFHTEDYVDDQHDIVDGSSDIDGLYDRIRIPSRLVVSGWNTTQESGRNLLSFEVLPSATTAKEDETGLVTRWAGTPLAYMSCFYGKWRGSLDITIEVVCTKIHQGQLMIAISPISIHEPTLEKCRACSFHIVDISQTTRYGISIPYMAESDYLDAGMMKQVGVTPVGQSTAYMYMFVQNPLTAPSTVSNTVDINVYMGAGKDFEFMEPAFNGQFAFLDRGIFQADSMEYSNPSSGDFRSGLPPTPEWMKYTGRGMEIVPLKRNAKTAPLQDQMKRRNRKTAQKMNVNIAPSTIDNILNRPYILKSAVKWELTQSYGTVLIQLDLPSALYESSLPPSGLANFHAYQHVSFNITIKVNPSPFHQGMLLAYWLPCYDDEAEKNMGFQSLLQYNHCILDMSAETEASVAVPYSYFNRMMRLSTKSYGTLKVRIWNQLRSGTGASSLFVTAIVTPVDGYIGGKTAFRDTAVFQADTSGSQPSDAAKDVFPTTLAFGDQYAKDPQLTHSTGYVRTNHSSMKDLMRRPDFLGRVIINLRAAPRQWIRIARVPAFGGKVHWALASTYTYWTGSNKIMCVCSIGVTNQVVAVEYGDHKIVQGYDLDPTVVAIGAPNAFNGIVIPQVTHRFTFTVDVPMYKKSPLVSTRRTAADYKDGVTREEKLMRPYVDILLNNFFTASTDSNISIDFYHSVGDDFHFFLPRSFPDFVSVPIGVTDGLLTKMTGANAPTGWTVSGTGITSGNQAWWAFDRSLSTAVQFDATAPRTIDYSIVDTANKLANVFSFAVITDVLPVQVELTITFNTDTPTSYVLRPGIQLHVFQVTRSGKDVLYIKFSFAPFTGTLKVYEIQAYAGIMTRDAIMRIDPRVFNTLRTKTEIPRKLDSEWVDVRHDAVFQADTCLYQAGMVSSIAEVYASMKHIIQLLSSCTTENVTKFLSWALQIVDKIITFLGGVALATSKLPYQQIVGMSMLCCLVAKMEGGSITKDIAMGAVAGSIIGGLSVNLVQHSKRGMTEDTLMYQADSKVSETIVEYVTSFVAWVQNSIIAKTGYACRSFSTYVAYECEGLTGMKYLARAVYAIFEYIIHGEKSIIILLCSRAEAFVTDVINIEEKKREVGSYDSVAVKAAHKEMTIIDKLMANQAAKSKPNPMYAKYSKIITDAMVTVTGEKDKPASIPEPIGVYVYSEPGVGKSTILSTMLPALLMNDFRFNGRVEDFCVSTQMDEQGRMDNYNGQPLAVFDEFLSSSENKDIATIIRYISQFSSIVQSAFMDKKGKAFRSRVMMVLTNLDNIAVGEQDVNNLHAMQRRFSDFSYEMVTKRAGDGSIPTFSMSRFSAELCEALEAEECTSKDILELLSNKFEFLELDIMTGRRGNIVSFIDFYEKLKKAWIKKEEIFAFNQQNINAISKLHTRTRRNLDLLHADVAARNLESVGLEDSVVNRALSALNDAGVALDDDLVGDTIAIFQGAVFGKHRLEEEDEYASANEEVEPEFPATSIPSIVKQMVKAGPTEKKRRSFAHSITRLSSDIKMRVSMNDPTIDEEMDAAYALLQWIPGETFCIVPTTLGELRVYLKSMGAGQEEASYPGIHKWLVAAGIVAATAVSVVGLLRLAQKYTSKEIMESQGAYDDGFTVRPKKASSANLRKAISQSKDERAEKIRMNLRKIQLVNQDGVAYMTLHGLCLNNTVILVNKHLMDAWKRVKHEEQSIQISIHHYDGEFSHFEKLELCVDEIHEYTVDGNNSDLCLIRLKRQTVARARDILSHIPDCTQSQALGRKECTLLRMDAHKDLVGEINTRELSNVDVQGKTTVTMVGRAFKFGTIMGDCGLPYLTKDRHPLVGLHCAKSIQDDGVVFFVPLTKKNIHDSLDVDAEKWLAGIRNIEEEESPLVIPDGNRTFGEGINQGAHVEINGLVFTNHGPTFTTYERTRKNGVLLAHPSWPDNMRPSYLKKDAFDKGIQKYYSDSEKLFPEYAAQAAKTFYSNRIARLVFRANQQGTMAPLTIDEAINGLGGEAMCSLQWSTSIGWLRNWFRGRGKSDLFELTDAESGHHALTRRACEERMSGLNVTFKERLEQLERMLEAGQKPFLPWLATLKDELRPSEKVAAKKTRVFEIPGVDHSIMIRKYFGQFLDFVKNNYGFVLCHGIGADKESAWAQYFHGLESVRTGTADRVYIDLDYANYDGSVHNTASEVFGEIVDAYYSLVYANQPLLVQQGHARARLVLLHSIIHGEVIIGKQLLRTCRGNKSGNPMTDVFNSITNVVTIYAAMCVVRHSRSLPLVYPFFESIRMLTYGDDVIMGVEEKVKKWLDLESLQTVLNWWGYDVTDGSKKEFIEWKTLEELVFLKSAFVNEGGVVLAPMPMQNIVKELQWSKKNSQGDSKEFDLKVENTLQFMAHRGPREYNRFVKELTEVGLDNSVMMVTWRDRWEDIGRRQIAHKTLEM